MAGFFLFIDGQFDKARECFLQVKTINKDLASLDAKHIPNALWRLESACNVGYMAFAPEEKKHLKGKNRLICSYAELNYLLEKFETARYFYRQMLESPKSDDPEKALALIGIACCGKRSKESEKMLNDAVNLGARTPLAGNAMICLASYYHADAKTSGEAVKLFTRYLSLFPEGRYRDKALFRLGYECEVKGRENEALEYLAKLKGESADSGYASCLEKIINDKGRITE